MDHDGSQPDTSSDYKQVIERIRRFRDDREWMQFHTPKEMAIAISLEANELLAHFLWKSPQECASYAQTKSAELQDEMADVAIFLFEFADTLGIDLLAAVDEKLLKNDIRYPVAKARGSSKKYTEL